RAGRIDGMRPLLPLLSLVLIAVPSTARADGCPPSTCGSTSTARPGSRIVLLRAVGRPGPLHAASAHPARTGARRYTLPPGILSADGRAFISSAAAKAPRTTVARYDVRSGRLV